MTRSDRHVAWRVALALRAWWALIVVLIELRRHPLPDATRRIGHGRPRALPEVGPQRLGRIVMRSLWVGPVRPRCLHTALVLYRLLQLAGQPAVLVIGLVPTSASKDAHAWVELDGVDVGPPPGKGDHQQLMRLEGPVHPRS